MSDARPNRWRAPVIGAVFFLCLVMVGVGGWLIGRAHVARSTVALPVLFTAPSYQDLTNQIGQTVSSAQFRGKVRVVTFLFPYCNTFCPIIAAHLAGFEHLLASSGLDQRVRVVAFNVDPGGTGPKQMRGFLKEYGWNPKDTRWEYLTGKPRQIRAIVTAGYHVDYEKVPDSGADDTNAAALTGGDTPQPIVVNPLAARAHVDYDITHENVLMLVDPQGRVRMIHPEADAVSKWQLLHEVNALLRRTG